MGLDIQTISLILGVTHLIQVLVFFYEFKVNKNIRGPGWWLLWCTAECVGFILIILRQYPSFLPYSIGFQDIILLAGTTFLYIGVVRFLELRVNFRFIIAFLSTFVLIHLFFYLVVDSIVIRSVAFAFFIAFISLATAYTIYRQRSPSVRLTANFNITIFLIHSGVFIYRGIMILDGAEVSHIFSPSLFNFAPYIDALIVSLLWTFGFILMINQRLNSEISVAKEHFESIFNTSPDSVIITRLSDGMIVDCNEGFTRIAGFTKEDITGNSTLNIHLWKDVRNRDQMLEIIRDKGYCENYETMFIRKNGQEFTGLVSAKIMPLKGVPHLVSVTRDITDRKRVEQEIQLKNNELQTVNAEKDKFFSIIAHDLRSPFNVFLGLTEVMVEGLDEMTLAKIKQIAVRMRESATNLFRLLENLLEWSRMEQGSIPFNLEPLYLRPLINDSLALILERAKYKAIEVNYDVPEGFMIYADKNILQTVIRNLVSNAVKFTPRGGEIVVSARRCTNNAVEITIRDTGIGMSPAMVGNLFKLDAQSNRKGTEGEVSSGLGLILCKAFIEKHGGSIWVESDEGKGSIFHFTIPCHAADKVAETDM